MDRLSPKKQAVNVEEMLLRLIDMPYDDLIGFLEDYANSHPEFCVALSARLDGERREPVILSSVAEKVDAAFRKACRPVVTLTTGVADRELLMNELSLQVQDFLHQAAEAVSSEDCVTAASVCLSVLRSAGKYWTCDRRHPEALDEFPLACDCEEAAALLLEVAHLQTPGSELSERIWSEMQQIASLGLYDDTTVLDFTELMAETAIHVLGFDAASNYLDGVIDRKEKQGGIVAPFVLLKLELLDRIKYDLQPFCWEYMHLPRVRDWYVEWLLGQGRREEVLRVLSEGIAQMKGDGFRSMSYLMAWMRKKLAVYEDDNDGSNVIETAHELFLLSEEKLPYYNVLKGWVDTNLWPNYLSGLLGEVSFVTDVRGRNELVEIYLEEQNYPVLFRMLSVHFPGRLMVLQYYATLLVKFSSSDVIRYFQEELRLLAEQSHGSDLYKSLREAFSVLYYLPGGDEAVRQLLAEFEFKYRDRVSLVLELRDLSKSYS